VLTQVETLRASHSDGEERVVPRRLGLLHAAAIHLRRTRLLRPHARLRMPVPLITDIAKGIHPITRREHPVQLSEPVVIIHLDTWRLGLLLLGLWWRSLLLNGSRGGGGSRTLVDAEEVTDGHVRLRRLLLLLEGEGIVRAKRSRLGLNGLLGHHLLVLLGGGLHFKLALVFSLLLHVLLLHHLLLLHLLLWAVRRDVSLLHGSSPAM